MNKGSIVERLCSDLIAKSRDINGLLYFTYFTFCHTHYAESSSLTNITEILQLCKCWCAPFVHILVKIVFQRSNHYKTVQVSMYVCIQPVGCYIYIYDCLIENYCQMPKICCKQFHMSKTNPMVFKHRCFYVNSSLFRTIIYNSQRSRWMMQNILEFGTMWSNGQSMYI